MKKNKAMVDFVEEFLRNEKSPKTLDEIISYVVKEKAFDEKDLEKKNQLYLDISTSGKYVYVGDDKWDLKERNLEFWDKDGIAFLSEEEKEQLIEEDYEDIDFSDFDRDEFMKKYNAMQDDLDEDEEEELTEEELKEKQEEAEYLDVELPTRDVDEDEGVTLKDISFDEYSDDDLDEDEYNETMDEYEHLYDD